MAHFSFLVRSRMLFVAVAVGGGGGRMDLVPILLLLFVSYIQTFTISVRFLLFFRVAFS
jgi:hypothetical protein